MTIFGSDGWLRTAEANHDVSARRSRANPALTRRAGLPRDRETSGRRGAGPVARAPRGGVSDRWGERVEHVPDRRKFLRILA